jgi:MFS family permease
MTPRGESSSGADHPLSVAAAIAVIAVAYLFYNLQPAVISAAEKSLSLLDSQLGFLAASHTLGLALGTISAVFWVRRVDWRRWSYAGILFTIAAYLLLLSADYALLLAFLPALGFAHGVNVSIALTCLGDTANPARSFGLGLAAQFGIAGLLQYLLPSYVTPAWGLAGCLLILAAVTTLTLPILRFIPRRGTGRGTGSAQRPSEPLGIGSYRIAFFALAGMLLYTFGQTAIWAFLELMGGDRGYDHKIVGAVLGIGLALSASGALLAAALGSRYGRIIPISIAALVFLTAMGIWSSFEAVAAFALAIFLYDAAWNFSLPFQYTLVTAGDPSGRLTPLLSAVQMLGGVFGPAVAGFLIVGRDYSGVYLMSGIAVAASTLVFILTEGVLRRSPPRLEKSDQQAPPRNTS